MEQIISTRMTLVQALRHLKRIKEAIAKISKMIKDFNSILKDGVREVDINKAIAFRECLKRQVVNAKLTLQEASRPIQRKIFEVAELKDSISFYQQLNCKHGKVVIQLGRYDVNEEREMDAVIRASDVEKRCSELQRQMDRLYNEIDEFNVMQYVELVPFPAETFDELMSISDPENTTQDANDES